MAIKGKGRMTTYFLMGPRVAGVDHDSTEPVATTESSAV